MRGFKQMVVKKIIFLFCSFLLISIIIFSLLKGFGEKYGLLTLIFILIGLSCLYTGLFNKNKLNKGMRSKLIVYIFGMKKAIKFYIYSGIFFIILGLIYFCF